MSDDPDSPGSGEEEIWSEVDEAFPDGSAPGRRDGFTPKRRRIFLKTLRKTGCVADACRRAGISDTAAYKLREREPLFARLWDSAAAQGGADMELLAWHYAVEGEEVEVWAYGKKVGTRRKRDAGLFRILLQGSNPHKYGGHALGTRKQIEKQIRREIEERRAAEEEVPDDDEVEAARERILARIEKMRHQMVRDEGGHIDEQGRYIPPGYVRVADSPSTSPSEESGASKSSPGSLGEGGHAQHGGGAKDPDSSAAESADPEGTGHIIGNWRSCPRPEDG